MPTASFGDNSKALTPAEAKALFFHHYNQINVQHEKVLAEQASEKKLRKVAKADGIVLSDVDFAMRCAKVDDPGIVPAQILRQIEIARWFALPIGQQADFDFNREPATDRAKREGAAAGAAAKDRAPPYAVDSRQGQVWLKEYDAAQAQARADLLAAMEKKRGNGADTGENDPDDDAEENPPEAA